MDEKYTKPGSEKLPKLPEFVSTISTKSLWLHIFLALKENQILLWVFIIIKNINT